MARTTRLRPIGSTAASTASTSRRARPWPRWPRSTYTSQSQAKFAWSVRTRAYATCRPSVVKAAKLSECSAAVAIFSRLRPSAQ
ncbi:hypothetical protein SHK17_01510 [Nocardioides renjunii]|nr:hypothetical protein [Nocardioides sp. S-34]WQQ22667.1 hypothetical protein SHK17_01510 [Nocardioides sp. S-34]